MCRQLIEHPSLLLQADPGAGKTTLVPLALLRDAASAAWLGDKKIILLEPRRLAARAAAARMAELCDEPVGATVGYRVRLDSRVSAQTRIEVLTEGVLTRRLQRDPLLEDVAIVIFDEFHERSLQADLGLALCLDVQTGLREDLRILLMSATLETQPAAALLNAPVLHCAGRNYPISTHYLDRDPPTERSLAQTVVQALPAALAACDGDLLVFLPGIGEIRQTQRLLTESPLAADLEVVALHGGLPLAEQRAATLPPPRSGSGATRRLVLATTIAETSLTIEGVDGVIDTGWTRTPRFDPRTGLSRLQLVRVSQDAATQRAGRAGRLGPGCCFRLWSEATQRSLTAHRQAEILQADLAPLLLEVRQWGIADPEQLRWLDSPPAAALAQARTLLQRLGVLDGKDQLSAAGRRVAELPLHPRLGRLLVDGAETGQTTLAADLVALLEERDPLRGANAGSDLRQRLLALARFRTAGRAGARAAGADPDGCAIIDRAAARWRQRGQALAQNHQHNSLSDLPADGEDALIGRLLTAAYPDRVAQRRPNAVDRYRLANGRGARLRDDDPLLGCDWLLAAHVDMGDREGRIFLAAALSAAMLEQQFPQLIQRRQRVVWDDREQAVISVVERHFGELLLTTAPLSAPDPEQLLAALLDGIRRQDQGLDALPWTATARQLQARVQCLRDWLGADDWPDWSDESLLATLEDWLAPYLSDMTRRSHWARLDLATVLHHRLDYSQQQCLKQLAPTHIGVPSGSNITLDYAVGRPPVLAVKLQELFGLQETPCVAAGKTAVLLHLLSPARRPIQVTQDLVGFWKNTYPEVKKELQGRYPKHSWPDDPWSATPTAKTTRRLKR